MDPLEIIASVFGVANLLLLVRRSLWNYAFGLAMVALYARIFFTARLYSDALLQLFFFVVQIYGWWSWRRDRADEGEVVVERLDRAGRLRWVLLVVPGWALWSLAMQRYTDTLFPFWDGAVAALSIAAQILLARRLIENWWLWILVDVLAIGLYLTRGLALTAGLYGLFLGMSLWGLIAWLRAERRQRLDQGAAA
jgi:nicotinamide mononucleotide transporter